MSLFKRGQFNSYRATEKIHLGKYETDIMKDDLFDYDGSTIRYSGMEYGVPQLRKLEGAWFVPESDHVTTYKPQPAGVVVSHATPEARDRGDTFTMDEASEEEAVVGTMTEQKQIREAAGRGDTERLAKLRAQRAARAQRISGGPGEVSLDTNPDAPPPPNAADVDPMVEAALMDRAIPQYESARPVHTSGHRKASQGENAAVARADAVNLERIARTAEHLEQIDPRKSRDEMGGVRRDDAGNQGGVTRVGKGGKFGLIRDESGGEVVQSYEFSKGATVGDGVIEKGDVPGTNVLKTAQRQPIQVGKAVAVTPQNRHAGAQFVDDVSVTHKPQAARAQNTTQVPAQGNVGIDHIGKHGATGDVEVTHSGENLEALLPGAAVAGRVAAPRPQTQLPPAPTEAEEIQEVLAGWSKRRNWQKRVTEAVDFYGDWPEALDAICEFESPNVVKQIRSKMDRQAAADSKA